jgi:type IV secretion system protein VirB2
MSIVLTRNQKMLCVLAVGLGFLFLSDPTFASQTGGGLPFDSWFKTIQKSITGPFAFAAAIIGMVGAGAGLIFGGADMNGFLRTLVFIVLVLSFLVTAQNTLIAVTGKGAEITAPITTELPLPRGVI